MPNPIKTFANVVTAPARAAGATAAGTARTLRDWSGGDVDNWGCDAQAVARAYAASQLRWDIAVGGTEHLPRRGGALIVVNARSLALAPLFAALAIGDAVGRPVRFVGRPDIAPIGPFLQRLGGLLPIEEELEGALRAGELVLLGAAHRRDNARTGAIDHALIGAAVAARARVLPAVTLSAPLTRTARVELGAPVTRTRIRRGPLAELELADALQRRIDELLIEFGGPLTGTLIDWLPGVGVLRGSVRLMPYVRASDGIRIHYGTTGRSSAPPVVMIQGLGADKNLWILQRLALAGRYRTIALDNRGAGRSDKPYGAYSLMQMVDDTIAVMDHAGAEDAHIVGASMGGVIAQILALRYPDRVRSLTLACTACQQHPWRQDLLTEWSEIARERGMRAMTSNAARWTIGPRSLRRISPAIGWLGPLALSRPTHAFAAQVNAILGAPEDLAGELSRIDVPTLVMVGNQDILTPRGDAEELAERIPTAELVVISGAAHGFMIEHATTFNRILLEFLGRAETAHKARRPEIVDEQVAG